MKTDQLFPRKPKRLRQPRKEVLREQLRLAADRIMAQAEEIERIRDSINACGSSIGSAENAARVLSRIGRTFREAQVFDIEERVRQPWWKRIIWRKAG